MGGTFLLLLGAGCTEHQDPLALDSPDAQQWLSEWNNDRFSEGFGDFVRRRLAWRYLFQPGPWTVPAMYSLITGLYPSEHGVCKGAIPEKESRQMSHDVLSDEATTLPERLRESRV